MGVLTKPSAAAEVDRKPAVAASSAVAGIVHLLVAPGHLDHQVLHGLFLIAVGVTQLGLARQLTRDGRGPLLLAGTAVNLALIMLYAVAHDAVGEAASPGPTTRGMVGRRPHRPTTPRRT